MTAAALAVVLLASACTAQAEDERPAPVRPSPSASPTADVADVAAVPRFAPGEIPPVPLIRIPDLSLLDAAVAAPAQALQRTLTERPGLSFSPARCESGGVVASGQSGGLPYGDTIVNSGDGSGTFTLNGVDVVVGGDRSGVWSDGTTNVVVGGDGSGTYNDLEGSIVTGGDGFGTSAHRGASIVVNGDGSGTYAVDDVTIVNNGDGSGTYSDRDITIVNNGDGTAVENGALVDAEPVAPVASVGSFPSMGSLAPVESCGVTITLEDAVLFDFDRYELRPDSVDVIRELAAALQESGSTNLVVSGHTDAIGTDAYNQRLSEQRADAVARGLREAGVTAAIDARGFGENEPVAPNELDGQDNPAGRQLNRRVEIVVPSA
ncbi:OmpA family protein [Arenivirga flava]|uniref:OmpA-like domain-containing protein n=1 Tax=Arenivirga flava TaxID=1930060 RepID=A0AA37UIL8_9MICO|nr:OmpA family protein [Arenivirga flava]GMA28436.1 hypothetical protein GCM10025874_16890 [Arenivirga flava]